LESFVNLNTGLLTSMSNYLNFWRVLFVGQKRFVLFSVIVAGVLTLCGFPHKVKAADPLVFVQIHTWWNAPWGTHRSPKNPYDQWGYWQLSGHLIPLDPAKTIAGSPFRRIITSNNYPFPYQGNSDSQAFEMTSEMINNAKYAGSYPFIGLYDSTDEDVIRYQIKSAKNAGITAFAVSVYDIFSDDRTVNGQPGAQRLCVASAVPFQTNGIERFYQFLEIAKQENFKVFPETYKPHQPVQQGVCGSEESWLHTNNRLITYVSHEAFLKINNQPVISIAWFPNVVQTLATIQNQMSRDIYWLVRHPSDSDLTSAYFDAVAVGHVLKQNMLIRSPDLPYQKSEIVKAKNRLNPLGKKVAAHIYPRFDDSYRRNLLYHIDIGYQPQTLFPVSATGSDVFNDQLLNSLNAGADYLWIESWNDYSEQTQIEQSRFIMGQPVADPTRNLKTLAYWLHKNYVDPPVPALEKLDPIIRNQFAVTTCSNFFGATISSNSVDPSSQVQVTCDYGSSQIDCVTLDSVPAGLSGCTFTGFAGTKAKYQCTAPSSSGTYTLRCGKFPTSVCNDITTRCHNDGLTFSVSSGSGNSGLSMPGPTSQPQSSVQGDLNNDRQVSQADVRLFIASFGKTGQGLAADFNRDTKVDIFDYNLLFSYYGK
jgi:hypothetical protein